MIAARRGNVAQTIAMLDELVPLIKRDRNPVLYASLISDLGSALDARGDFDRALVLHTDALEIFSARGDESRIARDTDLAGFDPASQRERRACAGHPRESAAAA